MRRRTGTILLLAFAIVLLIGSAMRAVAVAPANEHFQRTWARTDQPVASSQAVRTWMWGPEAFTAALNEPYQESPGGQRTVQYFDKARMEITQPAGDTDSIWYITNGLLVVELITGNLQTGDNSFQQKQPASVNVAGDADDSTGPTYATFGNLLAAAPAAVGTPLTNRLSRTGQITNDPALASQGLPVALIDDVTNHGIAAPFWAFMTSSGTIWDGAAYITAPLFENAYFATGRPITEAYWANVKVAGTYQDVLMQCFERRCLTYNPANAPEWRVEAGNVGQHYYAWRYPPQPPGGTLTSTATSTVPVTLTSNPSPSPSASVSPTPIELPESYVLKNIFGAQLTDIAPLGKPADVAVDPDGDIWVVDSDNHMLVEFDSSGRFKRTIGSQGAGQLQFNTPLAVTFADDGTLIVADSYNSRIQVISQDGTFIREWGSFGTGIGQFDVPSDIVVLFDAVYVADMVNNRVQYFDLAGDYQGGWGGLGSGDGQFSHPGGLAFDTTGNIYVADTLNHRIQVFTWYGLYLSQFGSQGTGNGQFSYPAGISVDKDGYVYVVEQLNNRVQVLKPGGGFELLWGGPGDAPGQLNAPQGIAIRADGTVLVADQLNGRVQRFSANGNYIWEIRDRARGLFGDLTDVAYDDITSGVLVADNTAGYERITTYFASGSPGNEFRPATPGQFSFNGVTDVAAMYPGTYYVLNTGDDYHVRTFSKEWGFISAYGASGAGIGEFDDPQGIAVDPDGNVYVADTGNNRIQKFDVNRVVVDLWGSAGTATGQFDAPTDIAIYGLIYVTDTNNHRVQIFSRDGDYVGQFGGFGTAPGQFNRPTGIAVHPNSGYVWVVDSGNNRIQKFDPSGQVLAVVGSAGSEPGQFSEPLAIAVDAFGLVYVADAGNYRIQVFERANIPG